ncbi:hypothetical protein Vadar_019508 [Vaccinium darrowii]|uniref:Uncharacterized protein n=1 Tax=Vaccinium darrowii TaxID=229202 RepID=A0ACB7XBK7_9ERIC|nr:hypothetical protein Vadar_019508 [Vaccinium darrowii]
MDDIANRASSDDSGKKFATSEANFSPLQPVYGLGQCTLDLSFSDCNACLRSGITKLPEEKQGGRVLFPSCYVRFETYPFFNASFGAAPVPPSPILPPPPPGTTSTRSSPGNGGISSQVLIAIVVPIGVAIMLFVAGFCCLTRWAKKKSDSIKGDNVGDNISAMQSLQYGLGTIQAATNNFSDDNKIGEGGFGSVYKAWKFWNDGAPLHLMDPTQKGPYSRDEVIQCIHIALLCVQDDPYARPSMATVVAMLDGYFATLSLPQQPAFLASSRTGLELDRKSIELSVNVVSISDLEPR